MKRKPWPAPVFWGAVVLSIALMRNGPMGWIFPMAAVVHRRRESLSRWLARWPAPRAFWFAGWVGGLATELFAVLGNAPRPPAERVLMHPRPVPDLVFGLFYYGLFMGVWTWLRRRWAFTRTGVFVVSGLFGLATEQGGAIARGVVAQPVLGGLLALLVMSVYGVFPVLALHVTEARWAPRPRPGARAVLAAAAAFFLFWAFYGLVVHRALLRVLPV